ncbi:DUF1120 domain-containing protein [Pseudomonas poae]|uniref:DUF1120 domain-containing protein n=1 Tax=Pseudomonas poae TaxID=200451 RepID=A0AAP2S3P4_9PSED|nr:DUF1120 domain-containing protein [Pseudomonas poae]
MTVKLFKLGATLSIAGFATLAPFIAHAASDINVKGVITPSACTVNIPTGNDLDWGEIPWDSLNKTDFTTLTAKPATIVINCPEGTTTKTAMWIVDADPSSALVGKNSAGRTDHGDSGRIFGIGIDPVTKNKIGNFVLKPVSTTVDGVTNTTNFGYNRDAANHMSTPSSRALMSNWAYYTAEEWSPLDASNNPASGTSFTWNFEVEPQINKASQINATTQVPWNGTAQVNVRYY